MYNIFYSDQITFNLEERATTLEKAKANILSAQSRQKKAYDQRHSNPYVFRTGGLVLKKDFKRKKRKGGKLDPKWVGPYTIVGNLGHGLYHLQEVTNPSNFISRVNGTHLKEYKLTSKVGTAPCISNYVHNNNYITTATKPIT